MSRTVCLAAFLTVVPVLAVADPYWIAYEGNDFPENEGWVRYASDPPAERWLENGSLFIDSRADLSITENYGIYFDGGLDPEPGETFIMRWRLRIQETHLWDPGVYVLSDDSYAVIFIFDEGSLLSVYEPDVHADFEPGLFHEFELSSDDMRSYELYIDGDLAIEGVFFDSLFSPVVGFGDIVRGGASLAEWDYFHFGVVPEPSAWLVAVIGLPLFRRRGG